MTANASPLGNSSLLTDDNALLAQVEAVLVRVRPILQAEGGDLRVQSLEQGILKLELAGGCEGCGGGVATLIPGMTLMMREKVPGLKDIIVA